MCLASRATWFASWDIVYEEVFSFVAVADEWLCVLAFNRQPHRVDIVPFAHPFATRQPTLTTTAFSGVGVMCVRVRAARTHHEAV